MAFPTNIGSGRVVGRFLAAVMDGPDEDQEPDYIPAQGTILLTPSIPYFPNIAAEVTITPAPITAILDADGVVSTPKKGEPNAIAYPGVRIFANDDPDSSVQNWTWEVKYNLSAGSGIRLAIPPHSITVLEGETHDLTKLVKVPSSPGVGIPQYEAAILRAEAAAVAAAEAVAGGTGGTGTVGPEGPAGPIGPQGPAGEIGPVGPIGEAGPVGTPGTDGTDGPEGPEGPEGPQGIPGPQGEIGQAGTPGAKGDTGPRGPIGADGPHGVQGDAGLTGDKGDTGAKGDTGSMGPAGADSTVPGPTGPKGDTGAAGTSTYADLPAGSTLTVPSTSPRPTDRTDIVVQFAGGTTTPLGAVPGDLWINAAVL